MTKSLLVFFRFLNNLISIWTSVCCELNDTALVSLRKTFSGFSCHTFSFLHRIWSNFCQHTFQNNVYRSGQYYESNVLHNTEVAWTAHRSLNMHFSIQTVKIRALNRATIFLNGFCKNNWFLGKCGLSKITSLQCYEVLLIHNFDAICTGWGYETFSKL